MNVKLPATLVRLLPQIATLAIVLILNVTLFPSFFDISFQNGRLYCSLIDVFNRGARWRCWRWG